MPVIVSWNHFLNIPVAIAPSADDDIYMQSTKWENLLESHRKMVKFISLFSAHLQNSSLCKIEEPKDLLKLYIQMCNREKGATFMAANLNIVNFNSW